jgi:hypothetical protein
MGWAKWSKTGYLPKLYYVFPEFMGKNPGIPIFAHGHKEGHG